MPRQETLHSTTFRIRELKGRNFQELPTKIHDDFSVNEANWPRTESSLVKVLDRLNNRHVCFSKKEQTPFGPNFLSSQLYTVRSPHFLNQDRKKAKKDNQLEIAELHLSA